MKNYYDFLISGQGLAGSLLAWQLYQSGKTVLLIDDNLPNASLMAAGLINPVSGKRLVKSSDFELLFKTAKKLYQHLRHRFDSDYFVELDMLRVLANEDQAIYAKKRLNDPEYAPYLKTLTAKQAKRFPFQAPYGLLQQYKTGYVLTQPLLSQLKQYFINTGQYLNAKLDYNLIKLGTDSITWNEITASKLIFCEGHQGQNNPWFNYLPFQPAKGEILCLDVNTELPDVMLNYGHWMIPLERNRLRTGATFEPGFSNCQPNSANEKLLISTLKSAWPSLDIKQTLSHECGIRPCTLDKQPFIGLHPKYPALGIFNGFGTKGCLQIPWYSEHFCKHLCTQTNLSAHCNIDRYGTTRFSD